MQRSEELLSLGLKDCFKGAEDWERFLNPLGRGMEPTTDFSGHIGSCLEYIYFSNETPLVGLSNRCILLL